MELDSDPPGTPGNTDDRAYNAAVCETPQGRTGVYVTIPAIGAAAHGPCRLQPVPGLTPQTGDRCLVVRGDGDDDWWIVQFDDRDASGQDAIDAVDARLDEQEAVSPSFYMRLENDVAGAFPNGVASKVPMDTIVSDPFGMVDLVNDWVTILKAGVWIFDGGALQVAAQVVGSMYSSDIAGASGGAVVLRTIVAANTPRTVHGGRNWVRCSVGDHVFLRFSQNGGTGTNQDADGIVGADFNYLRGSWISP